MDDRELLEAAARAAGISILGWNEDVPVIDFDRLTVTSWNPLTDDGDALRLAVKLKIPVSFPDWENHVRTWGPRDGDPCDEPGEDDLLAATRRAIVRAAAALAPHPSKSKGETE